MTEINTHDMIVDFGKHKGERYTRLPVSYLRWMVNENHSRADIAAAELQRRGTTLPDMDISGHAIDRASQHCLKIWKATARQDEGLHAWLCRMAADALEKGDVLADGKIAFAGMKFAFEKDGVWPVLKTVMRQKGGQDERD